jgi:alkylation response protein AidB-like acyl-CoA dehydrogenase
LIADIALDSDEPELDAAALYIQVVIDKVQLARHIRHTLQERTQVTLRELIDSQPLQQGLAELVAYLQLGTETFHAVVDEDKVDVIAWQHTDQAGAATSRRARLPRVVFVR